MSDEASWVRETYDEGTILTAGFRVGVDERIAELRRERDHQAAIDDNEINELEAEAARLRERRDARILRYDTRIGDLTDLANASQ